jgi:hypothetical protein
MLNVTVFCAAQQAPELGNEIMDEEKNGNTAGEGTVLADSVPDDQESEPQAGDELSLMPRLYCGN